MVTYPVTQSMQLAMYIYLGTGVDHAPPITDVQTDVHIVPVDCDLTAHNLLILPTPDVALVL